MSKKERVIFSIAAFCACLVLLDRIIFSPILNKLKTLNTEIHSQRKIIKESLSVIARKDSISKDMGKYSSYITEPLSEEEETASLLREIETLADKFSITFTDIKPAGLKDEGLVGEYNVNLNGEARLENLLDFIYKLENSSPILITKRFSIGSVAKKSDVLRFTMTISKIIVY